MTNTNGNKKAPKAYRRRREAREPTVTFDVKTDDGTAVFTARNLTIAEFRGLDDEIIGELPDGADPTGAKYLRERILKLELAVSKIENIDPDDLEATGGSVGKILRLPGNENLAWVAFDAYTTKLFGGHSKSSDVDSGDSPGSGELATDEGREADASVPDVRGQAATGMEGGA